MAAVTAQIGNQTDESGSGVALVQSVAGPLRTTAGAKIYTCFVGIRAAGTYAAGDGFSCANSHTAIGNALKSGQTIAIVGACFAAPGEVSGTKIGAKTVATSGNTITGLFTTGDLSTEWANGAMTVASFNKLVWLAVTFTATDPS